MRAMLARAPRRRPVVKYDIMFTEKVVIAVSNDKKRIFNNLFDLRKWDLVFVDSVCNEFRQYRERIFPMK